MTKMILIAGPYRSGTNDEMELIENNVKFMQRIALQVYRKRYLPVMGEWFALPLIEEAGSKEIGDEIFNEIFHPISVQLLDKCDAVLRVGGPSKGADEMVQIGKEKGKTIYYSIEEIPTINN
jgi:GDP-mannose pyrophosphatase NudK